MLCSGMIQFIKKNSYLFYSALALLYMSCSYYNLLLIKAQNQRSNYTYMGNQTPQFPRYEWQLLKPCQNYMLFHNNHGLLSEKYELNQQKNISTNQQLQIYKERSESLSPIIKVYSAQISQQKKNFCSAFQKIIVYTEHIPYRLTDVKSFSLSQNKILYILKQSVAGFQELFKKFGYFQISNQLIGFNQNGETKVWINSQIQSNRVQKSKDSILGMGTYVNQNDISKIDQKTRDNLQKDMIGDLWRTVKGKSNIQNRQIYQRLSNLQNCNFLQAKQTILMIISNTQKIPYKLNFPNSTQNQMVHSLLNYSYQMYENGNGNNYYNGTSQKQSQRQKDLVQVYDQQFLGGNRVAKNMLFQQPQFKRFQDYREFIDQLKPPTPKEKTSQKQNKQNKNPESPQKKKLNIDKIIDISLSSIPQQSSNRSIPNSNTSNNNFNDLNSFRHIPQMVPQLGMKRVSSYILPQNAVTETIILPPLKYYQQPSQYYYNYSNPSDNVNQNIPQNNNLNVDNTHSSRILSNQGSNISYNNQQNNNQNYLSPSKYNRRPIFVQNNNFPPPLPLSKNSTMLKSTNSRIIIQPQTPKFSKISRNSNY